jgi:hypothetical protein
VEHGLIACEKGRILALEGLSELLRVDARRIDVEDHVRIRAQLLEHVHDDVDLWQRRIRKGHVLEALRPDPEHHSAGRDAVREQGRKCDPETAELDDAAFDDGLDEVHRRRADERRHEERLR